MATMLRIVIAVALAVVVGVIALALLFSDLGPEESMVQRIIILGGLFFAGGILVGGIAGRKWRVSALCAWSPVMLGLTGLIGHLPILRAMRFQFWIELAGLLLVPLGVALLGGYVGNWLEGWIARRK